MTVSKMLTGRGNRKRRRGFPLGTTSTSGGLATVSGTTTFEKKGPPGAGKSGALAKVQDESWPQVWGTQKWRH